MLERMAGTSFEKSGAGLAHGLVRLLLLLFLLICIFDPANLILGAKVQVFVALWLATVVIMGARRRTLDVPGWLLVYVLLFVAIPVLSILRYYLIDGRSPFEGFQLLKGYLLISLALVLYVGRIDLMAPFSAMLTVLAALVVVTFLYLELYPNEFAALHRMGIRTGTFFLDRRAYQSNFVLTQVYFVTTPLLVFSSAYYFDRAMSSGSRKRRLLFAGLAVFNLLGMVLAGSRNNILAAALLPFMLWPIYARDVLRSSLIALGILLLCTLPFLAQLRIFFDPGEAGNSIRFGLLADYRQIFADPLTLLFGQGLGAYQYWGARGHINFISELTYLEMVRNFGLFGAVAMMVLLLLPVGLALARPVTRQLRGFGLAFFLYLVMCAFNPNLFSSMGILALSILIANLAMFRQQSPVPRGAT